MEKQKDAGHPLAIFGGILAAIGGWALSSYAGASLWIPGLATMALTLLFVKTPFRPKFFIGSIATTAGHVIWFAVGVWLIYAWSAVYLDIILLLVAILWLWLRPGLVAAIFLGIIQLASLLVNVSLFTEATMGSAEHKGLLVHVIWRIIALVCLVSGYITMRRQLAPSPPPINEADVYSDILKPDVGS